MGRMAVLLMAVAVGLMLFSGCALYDTKEKISSDKTKTASDMLADVRSELGTCAMSDMAFGTGKLPCCVDIDANGKCSGLYQLDPDMTYAKSGSSNEKCSATKGTCDSVDFTRTNKSGGITTLKGTTINMCPTFSKSICMENCTTCIFRDIDMNEKSGLSSADIHQLRLIFPNNDSAVGDSVSKGESGLGIKRLNMLYSTGQYQMIDEQVAKDLKGGAAMDIFRFGVGKSFADFDDARVLLPFSSEATGEVSQSGVESFPLYYFPKSAVQNCVMDLADYGYKCNNASSGNAYNKVFPTFEACLLNCVMNSNRLRPSDAGALNAIKPNRPLANDTYYEVFYRNYSASLAAGNRVLSLANIQSYITAMVGAGKYWQANIRTNVSEYLLDEFGEFGDSFTIRNDRRAISLSNVSMPDGVGFMAKAEYNISNSLSGYADILSRYDSTSYPYTFTLVDGKKKPGLPFECSTGTNDCKSGTCSTELYSRTGCKSTNDPNVDVKCGCDMTGCYSGTYTGSQLNKAKMPYYSLDSCGSRNVNMDSTGSTQYDASTKTVMASNTQYMAVALNIGSGYTLINNVSVGRYEGFGYYWWSLINQGDGYDKGGHNNCDWGHFSWYYGCTSSEDNRGDVANDLNWYYTSNWVTAGNNDNTQKFGYIFNEYSGCNDGPRVYQTQYEYITLGDRLVNYISSAYSSSMFSNLPIVKSCGMDSNDEHYVCVNPKVLNHGGNIMKDITADSGHAGRIYGCRLVQSISGLTIAQGTGTADSKVTITSDRLTSETCLAGTADTREAQWSCPSGTYAYCNAGNSGGMKNNPDPAYGTYQIQISGTKGVCEQLSADDFCFQTDAKGNCIKESAVMVLFSPGSDKKYGSCLANNGAVPDIRQYGMCTNPSYLTLAVQKIAPANMYLNNTLPNLGYAPASAATTNYMKDVFSNYRYCADYGSSSCIRATSGTNTNKIVCYNGGDYNRNTNSLCAPSNGDNDYVCPTGTGTCSSWYNNDFCSSGTESCSNSTTGIDRGSSLVVDMQCTSDASKSCVFNSARRAWVCPATGSPSCSGYTNCYASNGKIFCGSSTTSSIGVQFTDMVVRLVENTINFTIRDPKGSGVVLAQVPNADASPATAAPDFWPPMDYVSNKTRAYLQGGISVMLFAEHPGLYKLCYNSSTVNYSCKGGVATPFISKLLSDIYNKSNSQAFVPVGSAIVVTGRVTPYGKDCQAIVLGSTNTQFCYYHKDDARYNSTYYPTTADLDSRNKLVKSMCPGCRTAVEVAGSLKEKNGAFVIETQGSSEADVLMTAFKLNPIQTSMNDIYSKYGVPIPTPANPGTQCKEALAGPISSFYSSVSVNCGRGYRAVTTTMRYGEARSGSTTNTVSTAVSNVPYTLPNGTVVQISGTGSYTLTQDQIKCNTLDRGASSYCSLKSVNSPETFTFTPPVLVNAPYNGWVYPAGGSCAAMHMMGIVSVICRPGSIRPCTCWTAGTSHTITITSTPIQFPHAKLACTEPKCTDAAISTAGEQCAKTLSCINKPSSLASGTCYWPILPSTGCNSCISGGTRAMGWGALFVDCNSGFHPADYIASYTINNNPGSNDAVKLATILLREIEIGNAAASNSAGMDSTMCKRGSDLRTYYTGTECNSVFKSTDMVVLNLEIDPATSTSYANYEAWYSNMTEALVRYASNETYVYGKPIVVYVRSVKNASGFDPQKFMTVLGLNMERMTNAGIVAIHFEDWQKSTLGGEGAYSTDASYYNTLLYPIDEAGRPTQEFSALNELGKAISKKVSVAVPKSTSVMAELQCLNSTLPCIADSACISNTSIIGANPKIKIKCYDATGAIKITYAMTPGSGEEDMAKLFSDPEKYMNLIASVNRYSTRKICASSVTNSTYFLSFMSNPGYGIPVAWDQFQSQTCTATGFTNAEMLSFVTAGAADYICRLE